MAIPETAKKGAFGTPIAPCDIANQTPKAHGIGSGPGGSPDKIDASNPGQALKGMTDICDGTPE